MRSSSLWIYASFQATTTTPTTSIIFRSSSTFTRSTIHSNSNSNNNNNRLVYCSHPLKKKETYYSSSTIPSINIHNNIGTPRGTIISSTTGTTTTCRMSTMTDSNPPTTSTTKNLVVDPFCYRQFGEDPASKTYGGTVFSTLSINDFEKISNSLYYDYPLMDGYAPFCKHLFLPITAFFNDDNDKDDIPTVNILPVDGNEHLIRTSYVARNDKEVPVLQRYIPLDVLAVGDEDDDDDGPPSSSSSPSSKVVLPKAKYLDLILYSREQIQKENVSMGKSPNNNNEDDDSINNIPWGIVSIKAQLEDYELPMNPITQMRNALGTDQGGSGIPLDRNEYMKSVEYWSKYVIVS